MCEFISWIETKDKVYFLTKTQLESPRGEMLKLRFPGSGELTGHNAIRAFYDIDTGTERECTDFATPKNFPVVIAQAIKNNQMCYSNPDFSQLLLEKALKNGKQDPDVDKAWEDRNKAWEAYDKAGEDYNKAREAYDKAEEAYNKAGEDYNKAREDRNKAWEDRNKAWEAYDKAGEDYDKAWEAYNWTLFRDSTNRRACWR